MRKDFRLYRISLNLKEDADIINIMDSVPKPFRSLFVADAIRFAKRVILEPGIKMNSYNSNSSLQQLSLEIAIRKRRFFSHPVILRGLMPRSAVLSEAKELSN
jgi:hypothetical protein